MQAVFAKILNMSLTGSIVIAVVLLVRLLLKKAPKIYCYVLWGVVLFRLLCPLSISAGLSVLKLSPVTMSTTPGVSSVDYPPVQRALRNSGYVPAVQQQPAAVQEPEQAEPEVTALEAASYIWLTGAAVMAIYSVMQYLTLRHRLVGAAPYRDGVYLADHIATPFVMGVLRPKVYLPSGTPKEECRFIIAHERHHIRRHDPLWKLLGYAALCLHWFNPLVWLAFVLAGKDMEMSCDEAVIKRLGEDIRADYSQALLRLATHKRIVSGMPLAFGEGDTRGRVLNMARWKKPKVWVSILCVVLCLVILAACALNPKQKEKPLEGLTRTTGPASIGAWDLYFTLPEGCTEEMLEKDGDNWKDSREGCVIVMTDGQNTIGGVMAFPIPENVSAGSWDWLNWDWLHELDLPEWQDETLGYWAEGTPGDMVSVEFFSDVPEGQERTVLNEHNLYFYDGWIYDLWFDKLTVKPKVMEAILDSVSVGVEKTIPVLDMPYEIQEMPAGGYDYRTEADGSITFRKGDSIVGGIVAYPIPEGVYDLYDDMHLWLEDVGIPDFEDTSLRLVGGISDFTDGWKVTFAREEQPAVRRTHRFRATQDMVYDFWMDEMQLDEDAQQAIKASVIYLEPEVLSEEQPMTAEDDAFEKCRAVMDMVQNSVIHIRSECQSQNTPENNYTQDYYYGFGEVGMLNTVQTADGQTYAELWAYDDFFVASGADGELDWREEAELDFTAPWLSSFYFVKHYVTYVDTLTDEEGESYLFRVDARFEDTPDAAAFYFATFHFDADGNFIDVYLQINPARDDAYTLTQSIVTTDPQVVAARLNGEYARATK